MSLLRAGLALVLTIGATGALPGEDHPKVRAAWANKGKVLRALFDKQGLPFPARNLLIRVFKVEGVLELWGEGTAGAPYVLVRSYPICRSSGDVGPKRHEGDGQVPEGFYRVAVFNPNSDYHLSLGIDYPNLSDRILGRGGEPLGGAIMIHGNCVTIGCVPITDDGIEEVYLAALATHANGAEIPVEIFPERLTAAALDEIGRARPELRPFWSNLQTGYDLFEKSHRPPKVRVASDGSYRFDR